MPTRILDMENFLTDLFHVLFRKNTHYDIRLSSLTVEYPLTYDVGCLDMHGTHLTTNISTNDFFVFFLCLIFVDSIP